MRTRQSIKKVVDQYDFKQFTKENYQYKDSLRCYLEKTQANSKIPLDAIVTAIDDLGPELIMNLKAIDAYRYPQSAVFLYQDLLQSILLKHCWQNELEVK